MADPKVNKRWRGASKHKEDDHNVHDYSDTLFESEASLILSYLSTHLFPVSSAAVMPFRTASFVTLQMKLKRASVQGPYPIVSRPNDSSKQPINIRGIHYWRSHIPWQAMQILLEVVIGWECSPSQRFLVDYRCHPMPPASPVRDEAWTTPKIPTIASRWGSLGVAISKSMG